jgi:hypothetical protein
MSPAASNSSRTIPCPPKAGIPGKSWQGRPLPPTPARATAVPEATVNDTSSTAVTRLSARPRIRANLSARKRRADVATCEPVFGHPDTPGSEPLRSSPACQPSGKGPSFPSTGDSASRCVAVDGGGHRVGLCLIAGATGCRSVPCRYLRWEAVPFLEFAGPPHPGTGASPACLANRSGAGDLDVIFYFAQMSAARPGREPGSAACAHDYRRGGRLPQ